MLNTHCFAALFMAASVAGAHAAGVPFEGIGIDFGVAAGSGGEPLGVTGGSLFSFAAGGGSADVGVHQLLVGTLGDQGAGIGIAAVHPSAPAHVPGTNQSGAFAGISDDVSYYESATFITANPGQLQGVWLNSQPVESGAHPDTGNPALWLGRFGIDSGASWQSEGFAGASLAVREDGETSEELVNARFDLEGSISAQGYIYRLDMRLIATGVAITGTSGVDVYDLWLEQVRAPVGTGLACRGVEFGVASGSAGSPLGVTGGLIFSFGPAGGSTDPQVHNSLAPTFGSLGAGVGMVGIDRAAPLHIPGTDETDPFVCIDPIETILDDPVFPVADPTRLRGSWGNDQLIGSGEHPETGNPGWWLGRFGIDRGASWQSEGYAGASVTIREDGEASEEVVNARFDLEGSTSAQGYTYRLSMVHVGVYALPEPVEVYDLWVEQVEIVEPDPCIDPGVDGDANGDGVVNANDISYVIFRLGNSCLP